MITKENTRYVTPAFTIKNHEWRCVVFNHDRYGLCTHYQWRAIGDNYWRSGYDWPRYTGRGLLNGLPASLGRLYRKHYAEIQAALGKGPQATLSL